MDISVTRLAEIFLEQQQQGAHNLNLVTPTPYVPWIVEALSLARAQGFSLPVIYNTSSYDSPAALKLLAGWIDIYLPDLKYSADFLSATLSSAPAYYRHAMTAIKIMLSQVGHCRFDSDGMLKRGVLIRHLALPGQQEDSRRILSAMRRQFGPEIWFSLMNQYTPPSESNPLLPADFKNSLTDSEYEDLIAYALSLGLSNGFVQERGTASDLYIPLFNLDGVLAQTDSVKAILQKEKRP